MEQMYLVEVFIDQVTIYSEDETEKPDRKHLIVKLKIGPDVQFLIKETGDTAPTTPTKDSKTSQASKTGMSLDVVDGKYKWSRPVRAGKSYLFPSFPTTMLNMMESYPIDVEVWNDDIEESDQIIYVGRGLVVWDAPFLDLIQKTNKPCTVVPPMTIKKKAMISAECCCKVCGEVDFILRVIPCGKSIITDIRQNPDDPNDFTFKTDKFPSTFEGRLLDSSKLAAENYLFKDELYVEQPEEPETINVCTDLKTCSVPCKNLESCKLSGKEQTDDEVKKKPEGGDPECECLPKKSEIVVDKIRMGDIIGLCGNPNCSLAHKIRQYLRLMEGYRRKAGDVTGLKMLGRDEEDSKKICGTCSCKAEKYSDKPYKYVKVKCEDCGGMVMRGDTCRERRLKLEPEKHITDRVPDTVPDTKF